MLLLLRIPPNIHRTYLPGKKELTGESPKLELIQRMARGVTALSKESFVRILKRHKVKFQRCKSNKRSYNKWVEKTDFFIRHSYSFQVYISFDRKKKRFDYLLLKTEEEDDEEEVDRLVRLRNAYLSFRLEKENTSPTPITVASQA